MHDPFGLDYAFPITDTGTTENWIKLNVITKLEQQLLNYHHYRFYTIKTIVKHGLSQNKPILKVAVK